MQPKGKLNLKFFVFAACRWQRMRFKEWRGVPVAGRESVSVGKQERARERRRDSESAGSGGAGKKRCLCVCACVPRPSFTRLLCACRRRLPPCEFFTSARQWHCFEHRPGGAAAADSLDRRRRRR